MKDNKTKDSRPDRSFFWKDFCMYMTLFFLFFWETNGSLLHPNQPPGFVLLNLLYVCAVLRKEARLEAQKAPVVSLL